MEGGSLFNPGFLGGNFLWWVGQVADDSTWRDNHLAGKFEGSNTVPGWGRRYKVRIIGLHDKEEETIPSDQLPWALCLVIRLLLPDTHALPIFLNIHSPCTGPKSS